MTNCEDQKIVPSSDRRLARYSSDAVKRGLYLANSLIQAREALEPIKQAIHSKADGKFQTQVWRCLHTFAGHSKDVVSIHSAKNLTIWGDNHSIAMSSDGQTLATIDGWGKIKVWSLLTEELLYDLDFSYRPEKDYSPEDWMHQFCSYISELGRTYHLAISVDDQTLVSVSEGEIKIWHLGNGELISTLSGSSPFAISLNRQIIAAQTESSLVKIWHLRTGKLLHTFDTDSQGVEHVALSPDGQFLATAGGVLIAWNCDNEEEDYFEREYSIKIWNLYNGQLLHTLDKFIDTENIKDSASIEISPDGKTLVSLDTWISDKYTAKIWDLHTGRLLYTLTDHLEEKLIAISHDGRLVTCADDDVIKIWDLHTGQLLHTLVGHAKSVTAFTVSPDSHTLVSGSTDQTVAIWNLDTGKLLQTLSGHLCSVSSVTLSPNGQILASTDVQGTINIWKLSQVDDALEEQDAELDKQQLAQSLFVQGNVRYEAGDYRGAIEKYNELLNLDPYNTQAYNRRSTARSALGDYQGAMEDLQKAANF